MGKVLLRMRVRRTGRTGKTGRGKRQRETEEGEEERHNEKSSTDTYGASFCSRVRLLVIWFIKC